MNLKKILSEDISTDSEDDEMTGKHVPKGKRVVGDAELEDGDEPVDLSHIMSKDPAPEPTSIYDISKSTGVDWLVELKSNFEELKKDLEDQSAIRGYSNEVKEYARGVLANKYTSAMIAIEKAIKASTDKIINPADDSSDSYQDASSALAEYRSTKSKEQQGIVIGFNYEMLSRILSSVDKKYGIEKTKIKTSGSKAMNSFYDTVEHILTELPDRDNFLDDPNGLEEYREGIKLSAENIAKEIRPILQKIDELKTQQDVDMASKDGDLRFDKLDEIAALNGQYNKIIGEFKEEFGEYDSPELSDGKRTERWYNDMFRKYIDEAKSLPGAPAHIHDDLERLAGAQPKFSSSRSKFADYKTIDNDPSLVKQVANGSKPIAHTQSARRNIILKDPDAKYLAYILAPDSMGGGTIWYRPYMQAQWKFYDERILGADAEADKEERSTRPYDPRKRDPNLDIAELYIWNNVVNKSNPRIYNFINGLCLGYHKNFVIWFSESEYGLSDYRKPEKSLFARMVDRMKYSIRLMTDGSGRPGTVEADGIFKATAKILTGEAFNNMLDSFTGSGSAVNPYRDMIAAAGEYKPPKQLDPKDVTDKEDDVGYNPNTNKWEALKSMLGDDINRDDSKIIKSIFNKLDQI